MFANLLDFAMRWLVHSWSKHQGISLVGKDQGISKDKEDQGLVKSGRSGKTKDSFTENLFSLCFTNSRTCCPKCTTASQPQSASDFLNRRRNRKEFPQREANLAIFIAKCIATATVPLPQRNRNLFPRKSRCVQFDRVNKSQTLTANHRRETVHLDAVQEPGFVECLVARSTVFA